jgi:hypothetical protein
MDSMSIDKIVTSDEVSTSEQVDISHLIWDADTAQQEGRFDDAIMALEAIYAEFDRRAARYPL